jgi:hypothetical protein
VMDMAGSTQGLYMGEGSTVVGHDGPRQRRRRSCLNRFLDTE